MLITINQIGQPQGYLREQDNQQQATPALRLFLLM
jgi:hypothetical protein